MVVVLGCDRAPRNKVVCLIRTIAQAIRSWTRQLTCTTSRGPNRPTIYVQLARRNCDCVSTLLSKDHLNQAPAELWRACGVGIAIWRCRCSDAAVIRSNPSWRPDFPSFSAPNRPTNKYLHCNFLIKKLLFFSGFFSRKITISFNKTL